MGQTLKECTLVACQFYWPPTPPKPSQGDALTDAGQETIGELTFHACHFQRCFLGTATYENVRFTNCTFVQCDFMNAKFNDCQFTNCTYDRCTAWKADFRSTVVDPHLFLRGVPFPIDNYGGLPAKDLANERRRYLGTLLGIAAALLRSLADSHNPEFVDAALYYYKSYDFQRRCNRLLYERDDYSRLYPKRARYVYFILSETLRCLMEGVNLLATAGGTSLSRLLLVFLVINLIVFPRILELTNISYHGAAAGVLGQASWAEKVMASVEIFLAFGFTSFEAQDPISHGYLLMQVMLGMVWYAFLVPVLLRRTYR